MKPYLLQQLVAESAARRGDGVAVVDGERRITYVELHDWSNQIANTLLSVGVRRGDRVGLYLEKSLEAIVAIYGVLKAGAAYVPLDPNAPTSRLGYILKDCAIRCLCTSVARLEDLPDLLEHGAPLDSLLVLDDKGSDLESLDGVRVVNSSELASADTACPRIVSIDSDLAYVLYTSGSTGVPKGVMLSHRNAMTFVDWAVDEFGVGEADVISNHAPLHFDLSVFDLYAAASVGAPVVLVPPSTSVFPIEITRFIDRHQISIWYSVPSVLSVLALRGKISPGDLTHLRTVLFAGEVFPTKYLRELMTQLPKVRFANLFGPTETNVCTWYDVPPLPDDMTEPIPIGRAIANIETFVITDDSREATVGEIGELHVRGGTVMQGYWGDSDKTAKVLGPDPRPRVDSALVYRTGDLVEERSDGNYRFLGRRDAQVKSRGYRIELGDIEAALDAHPSVQECAAVAVPDDLITNRIRVFVAFRDEAERSEVVQFLSTRVPKYMVPDSFAVVNALPRTSTGKVDRRALASAAMETEEWK